jgi:hypothetical protein
MYLSACREKFNQFVIKKKKKLKKELYSNTLSSKISNSCLTYTEVVKIRKCFRCNKLSSPASNPNKGGGYGI